jgi:hypothetical protein
MLIAFSISLICGVGDAAAQGAPRSKDAVAVGATVDGKRISLTMEEFALAGSHARIWLAGCADHFGRGMGFLVPASIHDEAALSVGKPAVDKAMAQAKADLKRKDGCALVRKQVESDLRYQVFLNLKKKPAS